MVSTGIHNGPVFCFPAVMTVESAFGMWTARTSYRTRLIPWLRSTTRTQTSLRMSAGTSTMRTSLHRSVTIRSSRSGICDSVVQLRLSTLMLLRSCQSIIHHSIRISWSLEVVTRAWRYGTQGIWRPNCSVSDSTVMKLIKWNSVRISAICSPHLAPTVESWFGTWQNVPK